MAICGATTVGLIQPHFVPAAHDHGLPVTVGAGLLAAVGIFDVVGTIGSGWLTDRIDPRLLLLTYYVLRGLSLMALPLLFAPYVHPTLLLFVMFYGLDWVATIPPTMALVREHFGARAPVVFGWVFASHQVGAAAMALVAGIVRDRLHTYDLAWYVGGALCLAAGVLSLAVGRARRPVAAVVPGLQQGDTPTQSQECHPAASGARAHPGSVPRVELLERQSAKASLDAALTDAARGSGRMVFVAGEAGIGKTSLVRAFVADVPRGTRVLQGACDDLLTPGPLGAIRDVARHTRGPLAAALAGGTFPDVAAALLAELSARSADRAARRGPALGR